MEKYQREKCIVAKDTLIVTNLGTLDQITPFSTSN